MNNEKKIQSIEVRIKNCEEQIIQSKKDEVIISELEFGIIANGNTLTKGVNKYIKKANKLTNKNTKLKNKIIKCKKKADEKKKNASEKPKKDKDFYAHVKKLEAKPAIYKKHYSDIVEKAIYHLKYTQARLKHKIEDYNELIEWINLPEESKKDYKTKITFYKSDTLNYLLILLAVVFEIVYIIVALSVMPRDYLVGIMILFNIGVLLLLFISSLKIKVYVKLFSIIAIVFGAYNIIRISVVVPFILNINYSLIPASSAFWIIFTLSVNCLCCIFAGLNSLRKIKHKEAFVLDKKISFKEMSR